MNKLASFFTELMRKYCLLYTSSEFPQVWVSGLAADQRSSAFRGGTLRWERSSSVVADTSLQYRGTHGGIEHTCLLYTSRCV